MTTPSKTLPAARVVSETTMKPAKNILPERDPRVDPQPGDTLAWGANRLRTVNSLIYGGRRVVYQDSNPNRTGSCPMIKWEEWCRKNGAQIKR